MNKISVVIPTYKNKGMFLHNLKHNYTLIKEHEVIVVNDYPRERISLDVNKISKDIIVIENDKNLGFSGAVNKGVQNASSQYVMLLNSDVILLDNSFLKAVQLLTNSPKVFAVSFAQIEKNNEIVGKNILYWKKGLMFHKKNKAITSGFTAWAEGGASVIDKKKFANLRGFDNLYNPYYWEDIDLSYRAWKSGYSVYFDASIKVKHKHEGTISKYFSSSKIKKIAYRNQFLFIWKNIRDTKMVLQHLLLLPYNLFYFTVIKKQKEFLLGFLLAVVKYIPLNRKAKYKLRDEEVLNLIKQTAK